jgi:DNA-binding response OmpR family regulator
VETEGKVLIIDDDVDFQFMVGSMLRSSGYIVKSLLEGRLHTTLSIASECDLILLDIELPGMNGVDLGKQLKATPATANIPILLVSGHNKCETLFIESEANAFFQKPFSLSGLMSKIQELIRRTNDSDPEERLSNDSSWK